MRLPRQRWVADEERRALVVEEHVVRARTHALDGGCLQHSYPFTGTRGVGETTLARIFAKAH
ncbi:hypothetical protein ACU7M1_32100, partial [Burkholderia pseudomallei]